MRIAKTPALVLMEGMSNLKIIAVAGLTALVAPNARSEDKIDFAKDIQPILQKSCLECHGPEKPKGGLRLDSKEATLKGGKNGVVLVPGQADKSEIYRRITLPKDNDDVMPNKGDLLTKAQTDLVRDWINQGALANLNPPTVTSVSPSTGGPAGGSSVTVTGTAVMVAVVVAVAPMVSGSRANSGGGS